MQRSKNLALMFLLGAVLVGGVLGFSADRWLLRERLCPRWGSSQKMRERFATELALTPEQRAAVDSILDERHRLTREILKPVQPRLDAVYDTARAQIKRILTPEQRERFDRMRRGMKSNTRTSNK